MTTSPDTQAAHHVGGAHSRGWFWLASGAIATAQVTKYPAMRRFVDDHLHEGPDTSDLPDEMLKVALDIGAALGLALSTAIGLLLLSLALKHAARFTRQDDVRKPLPYWLSGTVVVGLIVPDLVTAATGVVFVTSTPYLYLVYLPLAGVAMVAAPPPTDRRLRFIEVLMIALLPFA